MQCFNRFKMSNKILDPCPALEIYNDFTDHVTASFVGTIIDTFHFISHGSWQYVVVNVAGLNMTPP